MSDEPTRSIFELLRSDGHIVVNKKLATAIGLNAAIVYSELMSRYYYFKEHGKLTNDGYFFNTIEDLEEATTLTKHQQPKAIKKLCQLRLIDCDTRGMPAKRYFRINQDANTLFAIINGGSGLHGLPKSGKLVSRKAGSNNNNNINYSTPAFSESNGVFSVEIFKKQIRMCYKQLDPQVVGFSLVDIFSIVDYFMSSYVKHIAIRHPPLSNDTVTRILENLSECTDRCGVSFSLDVTSYGHMIDFYFAQKFKGNQDGICNYSLAHFILSDDIRVNCYYKVAAPWLPLPKDDVLPYGNCL